MDKINNSKVEVPETNEMNDKDYITTILLIEKAMVKNYTVAMTEASNTDLYNDYFDMLDDLSNMQREIYNLMIKKRWYCLEMVEENKINQKLDVFEQELSQLENNS